MKFTIYSIMCGLFLMVPAKNFAMEEPSNKIHVEEKSYVWFAKEFFKDNCLSLLGLGIGAACCVYDREVAINTWQWSQNLWHSMPIPIKILAGVVAVNRVFSCFGAIRLRKNIYEYFDEKYVTKEKFYGLVGIHYNFVDSTNTSLDNLFKTTGSSTSLEDK